MKRIFNFLLTFSFFAIYITGYCSGPVKIIFDTDMGPDYDDVGAIAVLHSLAAKGECEILACCASDRYPYIAPTIEAFNRYFHKTEIPVGVPVDDGPDFSCSNHWNDSVAIKFLPKLKTNADYPSAVEVYRKTLASQPDHSVTIITVGFVTNLEDLLKSGSDRFSPLAGPELVRQKVAKLVAMAGKFPEGSEFNVNQHPEASFYVYANWPTPILFSGFEIGDEIYTGGKLAREGSKNNPARWAYKYNLATYAGKPVENRKSWDLTAVLCAIRNPENYFYVEGPGTFVVGKDGSNKWDPDANSGQYFLVHKYPYQKISGILDELMMYEPGQ